MSMMYPNGSPPQQNNNPYLTVGSPSYASPLLNFGQIGQALQQRAQQRPQAQPGAVTPPSGPNMGGKAAGQNPGAFDPSSFAAGLRKFFTPGGAQSQPAPGGPGGNVSGSFAPGGGAPGGSPAMMPQDMGAGFGGGGPAASAAPIMGGAGFSPFGLY